MRIGRRSSGSPVASWWLALAIGCGGSTASSGDDPSAVAVVDGDAGRSVRHGSRDPDATRSVDRAAPVDPSSSAAAPTTTPVDPLAQAAATELPRLVVLGVAQDAGVPQAGCDCARCRAAADDPEHRPRVASAALMLEDGRAFLLDATPDLTWQLRDLDVLRGAPSPPRRPVDGILLTHGHMGHYLGLAWLGFESAHTDGVEVYGTARMHTLLRDHAPWAQLVEQREIVLRPLSPGQPLDLGRVRVVPIEVPHRAEYTDTLALRVQGPRRTVLYLPDCDPWSRWDPDAAAALLRDVDVALLDGTFYSGDELPGRDLSAIGHPFVVDTMAWIEAQAGPQAPTGPARKRTPEVWFVHLNHSNPALEPEGAARRELAARGFAVAHRGLAFAL